MARSRNPGQPPPNNLRRPGQPCRDLHDICAYDKQGKPIRVIDRAVETVRLGLGLKDVARRCGIAVEVVGEWERRGTVVSTDIYAGRRRSADLSKHERKCFEFVQLTAQADAERATYWAGLAEKLAAGGFVIETVTEKVDADGKVLERSTKRSAAAPDGQMIRWGLERARREEFGQHTAVELTGPGGGPVQIEAAAVIDLLLGEVDRIAVNTEVTDVLLAAHEPAALTNGKG